MDHAWWLEKQLGLINKIGLQNYMQSQLVKALMAEHIPTSSPLADESAVFPGLLQPT